jgi:hypothetical protein
MTTNMRPSSAARDDTAALPSPPPQLTTDHPFAAPQDFSIVLGGPLFQVLRRAHLSGDALELIRQRIIIIIALAWLPLLLLSIVEGHALGGGVAIPFLMDMEVNVRFLVALPLLIYAELVVHERMRPVIRQFHDRHLIPESAEPRFDAAIVRVLGLRNSVLAEIALIIFVYVVGVTLFWRHYVAVSATTWYATPSDQGLRFSLTGIWYGYVSLPLFQFLLMRWYYRICLWAYFLWRVSRIGLSLIPTHPDRVGGLGFLANFAYAFTPLALAHGAVLTGPIANRIFYLKATLPEFKIEIAVVVAFVLLVVFAPFFVFSAQLARTKRAGLREYGTLAERYVREFDAKWLRGGAPRDEPLVGSADVQSLADLANSFDVVKTMRLAPITRDALLRLVGSTLAPVVPLALTMMSPEELLKKLFGLLL